jgi:hypothetical protein
MQRIINVLRGMGFFRRKFKLPINYKRVWGDNFNDRDYITENGYDEYWRTTSEWGWIAINSQGLAKDYWFVDSKKYPLDYGLNLECSYSPISVNSKDHHFLPDDLGTFSVDWGSGMVETKKAWKYGVFEASIHFPQEVTNLWAAFWLTGDKSWPPEIDIVEAYSGQDGNYHNGYKPNIYFKKRNNVENYKAYPVKIKNDKGYINFKLWWEKDFIKIYYNNELVMKVTDKKILEQMNEPMRIKLNTGVHNMIRKPNKDSDMIVNYVRVYQK